MRMKRHLLLALTAIFVILILYFLGIIEWILTTSLLILIFPYVSFSLFFMFTKSPKKEDAIDITRRAFKE